GAARPVRARRASCPQPARWGDRGAGRGGADRQRRLTIERAADLAARPGGRGGRRLPGLRRNPESQELLEPRDRGRLVAVQEGGHPDGLGSGAVLAQVVDEDAAGGGSPQAPGGEEIDL